LFLVEILIWEERSRRLLAEFWVSLIQLTHLEQAETERWLVRLLILLISHSMLLRILPPLKAVHRPGEIFQE